MFHIYIYTEGSTDDKDLNASIDIANSQRMDVHTHGTRKDRRSLLGFTRAVPPCGGGWFSMYMWPDKIPSDNQDWSCLDDRTRQAGNSHHPYFWNLRHLARATGYPGLI